MRKNSQAEVEFVPPFPCRLKTKLGNNLNCTPCSTRTCLDPSPEPRPQPTPMQISTESGYFPKTIKVDSNFDPTSYNIGIDSQRPHTPVNIFPDQRSNVAGYLHLKK